MWLWVIWPFVMVAMWFPRAHLQWDEWWTSPFAGDLRLLAGAACFGALLAARAAEAPIIDKWGLGLERRDAPRQNRLALACLLWGVAALLAGVCIGFFFMEYVLAPADGWPPEGVAFGAFMTCAFAAAITRSANFLRHLWTGHAARLVEAERALAVATTRALQAQMHPHFLFNALNTIAALFREDPARARAMLLNLKALLARTLSESEEAMTTIGEEVAFVKDYLVIEQERFGDRLRVVYVIDPALLPLAVPVLSLQPLVENAVRHGISTSIEGGLVRVIVRGTPDGCDLVVEDDGPGPDGLSLEGTGLENVRQRLHATLGPGATLTLERTAGHLPVTRATIHVP
jgi:hypothetical protein